MNDIKIRVEESANYKGVFFQGKTIRIPLDELKPITELKYPEFYDVGINSLCYGRCDYCYTCATSKGYNFPNILNKINGFFGKMTPNQRPFQVAIGGSGEATLHPDFIKVLELFHQLGIVPNYTTNGMHLSDDIVEATKKYCGGVALTLHRHLEKHWRNGIQTLSNNSIKTNVHIVVSDKESIDFTKKMYNEYADKIDYFVLLPHMNVGFASNNPKIIDYPFFKKWLFSLKKRDNLAFGANFYEFLKNTKSLDCSLYPPEILSKYIVMDDNMMLYNSSFGMTPVKFIYGEGVE